jgi:hypothetical protein
VSAPAAARRAPSARSRRNAPIAVGPWYS